MYAHDKACRPDKDRVGTGAYYPIDSMVWESYDGIIGDAPTGRSRWGECLLSVAPSGVASTQQPRR